MMRQISCCALTCLAVMAWAGVAGASLLIYQSPEQLGAESDVVARGKVESTESFWNDGHTKVYTRIRITVHETYKGAGSATLELIQLGGVVGPLRVTAHGAPGWTVGEEVLVFAERSEAGAYRVAGFSQGKFTIIRNPLTGEARVLAPETQGAQLLGAPADERVRGAGPRVPLDEFVDHALGLTSGQELTR